MNSECYYVSDYDTGVVIFKVKVRRRYSNISKFKLQKVVWHSSNTEEHMTRIGNTWILATYCRNRLFENFDEAKSYVIDHIQETMRRMEARLSEQLMIIKDENDRFNRLVNAGAEYTSILENNDLIRENNVS
jgi:hypothetical protein